MLDGDFSYGSLITHTLIFYGVKNHRCINFKGLVKKTIHLKITSTLFAKQYVKESYLPHYQHLYHENYEK